MNTKDKFTYGIELDTTRLQMVLEAISKHTNNLKEELKQIEETLICDCGCIEYKDELVCDVINHIVRTCLDCGEKYVAKADEVK